MCSAHLSKSSRCIEWLLWYTVYHAEQLENRIFNILFRWSAICLANDLANGDMQMYGLDGVHPLCGSVLYFGHLSDYVSGDYHSDYCIHICIAVPVALMVSDRARLLIIFGVSAINFRMLMETGDGRGWNGQWFWGVCLDVRKFDDKESSKMEWSSNSN